MTLFFAFGLWQAALTAVCEHGQLDEPFEIFRRCHTACDLILDPYVDFEEKFRWLCEMNSFADNRVFKKAKDNKVMCECPENPWRRFRETVTHYEKSRECFSTMQDLPTEIYYEYKTYLTIIVAVIFLFVIALVYYYNDLKKSSKKANEEQERLPEELYEKEMFHNIQETNYTLN